MKVFNSKLIMVTCLGGALSSGFSVTGKYDSAYGINEKCFTACMSSSLCWCEYDICFDIMASRSMLINNKSLGNKKKSCFKFGTVYKYEMFLSTNRFSAMC